MAGRSNPLSGIDMWTEAMERLLDGAGGQEGGARPMPLDIYETEDDLVVRAALPGFSADDVDISILGSQLTLHARRPQEGKGNIRYLVQELWGGDYARSIPLPAGVDLDAADAAFEDGVLTLRLPKAESAKPKQIPIKVTRREA